MPLLAKGNATVGGASEAGFDTTMGIADDDKADTDDDESKVAFACAQVCSSSASETRPGSSSIANACRAKKCAAHASTLSPRALTEWWGPKCGRWQVWEMAGNRQSVSRKQVD